MSEYVDLRVIKLLAQENWRGVPDIGLLASLQKARYKLDVLTKHPDCCMDIVPSIPSNYPGAREEYIELEKCHYKYEIEGILEEIERRRNLNTHITANHSFDKELIEAIRDKVPIADVLEWYTDVFIPKGCYQKNWTFRCTLHGTDQHPSGVIYPQEKRWWCFVCNKGGDVFDAVQLFENISFPKAVSKLARYIGLDTKPIFPKKQPRIIGGVPV